MQITKDMAVTIDYTLTAENGELLDTTEGTEPLIYLHGAENIVPGLEDALEGKAAGDRIQVTLPPEQAYGEWDQSLEETHAREEFSAIQNLEVGMELEVESTEAHYIVTITNITKETVTLDANHPLAGMVLNFDVTVVDVQKASEEEISHGHIYGPEGQHH